MSANSKLPDWPALKNLDGLPAQLEYERGIYGKVHGARSDFRWIAKSIGFDGDSKDIQRKLYLGDETLPATMPLWKTLNNYHYAVHCYASRATDASGRKNFVEKQFIEWRSPLTIPSALGALVLLPKVVFWRDERWWDNASENLDAWADSSYKLELTEKDTQPIAISAEKIAQTIDAGCQSLAQTLTEEMLVELYAVLLSEQKLIIGSELQKPLEPAALATLLLPLQGEIADKLSFAGWLPSSGEVKAERLEQDWSLVFKGGATHLARTAIQSNPPSAEHRRQAEQMMQAIINNNPSQIKTTSASSTNTQKGNSSAPQNRSIDITLWGPSSAGKTVFLGQLAVAGMHDDDWKVDPANEFSLNFSKNMREQMRRYNVFPSATAVGDTNQIHYRLYHEQTHTSTELIVEDRAGTDYQEHKEEVYQRLSMADGLVLLFDPLRDPSALEQEVWDTLAKNQQVNDAKQQPTDNPRDTRPIAVCISKADMLIHSLEDYEFARDEPDSFVRKKVDSVLIKVLEQYASNYRLFPISSAGLRLHFGAIEPTVFYDENLELRISTGGKPFNLLAPFAWLTEQLS